MHDDLPEIKTPVLQCIQDIGALSLLLPSDEATNWTSGDVFFVPDFWGHAVVNLEESVGYAQEFVFAHRQPSK